MNTQTGCRIRTLICALLLGLAITGCFGLHLPSDQSPCVPSFPNRDGWYGADGAYSILLSDNRTLWLFGDTFVSADPERNDRAGMDIIFGNTAGISSCSSDRGFQIRYYFNRDQERFLSVFGPDTVLWPQDPFFAGGTLYIPLLEIASIPHAVAPYNFRIAGHRIARVRDASPDDLRQWEIEYLNWTTAIPNGIEALAPTSVTHGDHVYFFSLYRHDNPHRKIAGNILTRLPQNQIDETPPPFEFLTRDGRWGKTLHPDTVAIVLDAAVSELSVRYHDENKRWVALYLSAGDGGRELIYQWAFDLYGPWSDPATLVDPVVERDPESESYNKETFCYAGKEHRQFAHDEKIVVTYVCNSSSHPDTPTSFLRRNLFMYRPVVLQLALP